MGIVSVAHELDEIAVLLLVHQMKQIVCVSVGVLKVADW